MSNWLTLKKNRPHTARYLPLDRGHQFKCSEISLLNENLIETQSTAMESTVTYQLGDLVKRNIDVLDFLADVLISNNVAFIR